MKRKMLSQFEAAFPRLMDQVYAGWTLHRAVKEYPLALDYGQFNRWLLRDPKRRAIYEEAQEYRAEVWADRMIAHAEGEVTLGDTDVPIELDRAKFANDTYKFLMSRQSKKRYGETKTVELEHKVSIKSALEQAQQRVIEAQVIEAEVLSPDEVRMLTPSEQTDDEDYDDGDD